MRAATKAAAVGQVPDQVPDLPNTLTCAGLRRNRKVLSVVGQAICLPQFACPV